MSADLIVVEWLKKQAKSLRESGPRLASSPQKFSGLSGDACETASQACEVAASVLEVAADEIDRSDV